jgi:hypothetical protein
MAAPEGNSNNKRGTMWNDALRKALVQSDYKQLHSAAKALLDKAAEGEQWAIKELADRLDGKAFQSVQVSGDPDNPLGITVIERRIVDPKATD